MMATLLLGQRDIIRNPGGKGSGRGVMEEEGSVGVADLVLIIGKRSERSDM